MPSLKLLYFDKKGRAEPVYLALAAGGLAFSEERTPRAGWPALQASGRLPVGQVPVLYVDGVAYTQSLGQLRYVGALGGLYPAGDPLAALYVDEVVALLEDAGSRMMQYRGRDVGKMRASQEAFVEAGGVERFFGGLQRIVEEKSVHDVWMCGDAMTVADLVLFYVIGSVLSGNLAFIPDEMLLKYERLMVAYRAVGQVPEIREWEDKHPWKP